MSSASAERSSLPMVTSVQTDSPGAVRVHDLSLEWRSEWDKCVTALCPRLRLPPVLVAGDLHRQRRPWHPLPTGRTGRRGRGSPSAGVGPERGLRIVPCVVALGALRGPRLRPTRPPGLVERSIDVARRQKARYIEFHSESAECEALVVKSSKVSMRRELAAHPDALWHEFPPSSGARFGDRRRTA